MTRHIFFLNTETAKKRQKCSVLILRKDVDHAFSFDVWKKLLNFWRAGYSPLPAKTTYANQENKFHFKHNLQEKREQRYLNIAMKWGSVRNKYCTGRNRSKFPSFIYQQLFEAFATIDNPASCTVLLAKEYKMFETIVNFAKFYSDNGMSETDVNVASTQFSTMNCLLLTSRDSQFQIFLIHFLSPSQSDHSNAWQLIVSFLSTLLSEQQKAH